MRKRVYLDTSIISAYWDDKKPERQKITQKWLTEIKTKYEIYISEIVKAEILATSDPLLRQKLVDLTKDMASLEVIPEVRQLARAYLSEILSEEHINDLLQIAIATIYGMDILVSWNFGHMVNLEVRCKVKAINLLKGYREIEIVSPLELGGDKYAGS